MSTPEQPQPGEAREALRAVRDALEITDRKTEAHAAAWAALPALARAVEERDALLKTCCTRKALEAAEARAAEAERARDEARALADERLAATKNQAWELAEGHVSEARAANATLTARVAELEGAARSVHAAREYHILADGRRCPLCVALFPSRAALAGRGEGATDAD